jgi:hypothetical protein
MDLASNKSASPLREGEWIEMRGFSEKLNRRNPHPALSLLKGEAKILHSYGHVKSNDDS